MRDWDKCHRLDSPMLVKNTNISRKISGGGRVHLTGQFVFYNLRTTCATLIKLCISEKNLFINIFLKTPLT